MKILRTIFGAAFLALLILTGISSWRGQGFLGGLLTFGIRILFMWLVCVGTSILIDVIFKLANPNKGVDGMIASSWIYYNFVHPSLILFFNYWAIRYWL